MVVTNAVGTTVSVFLNNGNGTFATKVDYTTGSLPEGIALGDVNGDGKADIVTANYNTNTVSVFLNNGNGTFATKVDYTTGSSPVGIALGDVNGDGKADMVVANNSGTTASVFLNSASTLLYASASTGNVVIGTTTATSKLSVVGTGGSTQDVFSVASSTGTKFLTVKSTGRVGIGTTTPFSKLTIASSSDALLFDVGTAGTPRIIFKDNASSTRWIVDNQSGNYRLYTSTTTVDGSANAKQRFFINGANGNVSIGTTTSGQRLTVVGTTTSYIAKFLNTNTTVNSKGLLISLGIANASRAVTNRFIDFAQTDGTVAGKIQGGASAVAFTTTAADLAEFFPVHVSRDMPDAGEIVALDPLHDRAIERADNTMVPFGIVTTNPGFIGNGPICKAGDDTCDEKYAEKHALVSLVGQVPLKVSNENGEIKSGDSITISSHVGVGKKADFGDTAVGYALQASKAGSDATSTIMVFANLHTALGMNPSKELQASLASSTTATSTTSTILTGKTIMERVVKLVSGFVNGVLKVAGIKTDQLCIGNTCVNEAQLIDVLQYIHNNPQNSGGGHGASSSGGSGSTGGGSGAGTGGGSSAGGSTGSSTSSGTGGGGGTSGGIGAGGNAGIGNGSTGSTTSSGTGATGSSGTSGGTTGSTSGGAGATGATGGTPPPVIPPPVTPPPSEPSPETPPVNNPPTENPAP